MARIMIVDDSAVMRRNLTFALTGAGHEVVAQAINGEQAYYFYKLHTPDLVTMDITMPDVNGIEAVKRIIKDYPGAKIIMVSALDQKQMVLEALKYGAKHYIIKPINPDHLSAIINKVLGVAPASDSETEDQADKMQLKGKIKELEISRKKLEEDNLKLAQLSNMDGLTGIPNRRHFDSILANEWKRALRDKMNISLLMIDIDFFKNYNDSLGHLAGDECIKNVARLITANLKRPYDVAARYGGEEFSVILPGTDRIGAVYVAEFIRDSVEQAMIEHPSSSVSPNLTVSIGIGSAIPNPKNDFKDLIRMADEQLYLAKQQGRNRVADSIEEGFASVQAE